LLAGDAAADGVQIEACILRSLNRHTQGFTQEGWHLDSSLFHV
jgi:hypothetical protein